jgi:hypothetical protein
MITKPPYPTAIITHKIDLTPYKFLKFAVGEGRGVIKLATKGI